MDCFRWRAIDGVSRTGLHRGQKINSLFLSFIMGRGEKGGGRFIDSGKLNNCLLAQLVETPCIRETGITIRGELSSTIINQRCFLCQLLGFFYFLLAFREILFSCNFVLTKNLTCIW